MAKQIFRGRSATNFLVVSEKDTDWMEWNGPNDRVLFHWQRLGLNEESPDTDIPIAVARAMNDLSIASIQRVSETLGFIKKAGEGENASLIILCVDENGSLLRTGYVTNSTGLISRGVVLNVEWFKGFENEDGLSRINIEDYGSGYFFLSGDEIENLGFQLDDDDDEISPPLPPPPTGGSGAFKSIPRFYKSAPPERIEKLEETKPLFRIGDPEETEKRKDEDDRVELNRKEKSFFRREPRFSFNVKSDPGSTEFIFYSTNREKTGQGDFNNYYGTTLGDLEMGWLKVNIPPGHKVGKVERPKKILFFKIKEKDKKHIMITDMLIPDENRFYELLDQRLKNYDNSALIFIHGYNTSFAECAWRTAQISYDVNFRGVAGFFSWPSAAKSHFYGSDIEYSDASIPDLEKFVRDFIKKTGVEEIHFVAHSMGNRLLTSMISNLQKDTGFSPEIGKINQLIMAAPDLDQDVFKRNIMPYFQAVGKRRTLYASDRDKALAFAEWLRINRPRLGDGGGSVFVQQGIDSIDASNINPPKWLDHSYVFETKPLISDLKRIIYQNDPPDVRDLKPRSKNGTRYWIFPK